MSSTEGFSESTALPLHGLPVAIKEDHNVEGMDTTLGFAKNLYKPVKGSAVLVKILLKLGAVPFIKTNVPQSLYSNGSDNPIFGTTLNCLNTKLSPAGSSSGSACIVAAGLFYSLNLSNYFNFKLSFTILKQKSGGHSPGVIFCFKRWRPFCNRK